jgi:hypothetical protein
MPTKPLFFEAILSSLDKLFEVVRTKVEPKYPYDKETKQIRLPNNVENEIY